MGWFSESCIEQRVGLDDPGGSRWLTKEQIFTLIATASINFSSMICYSILGPFFPREAEKKGATTTIVGLIFGCFAVFNFITSLIMGKYVSIFKISYNVYTKILSFG
uniref:Uncharacterized protein n=1 Tax=Salvator merianae TaxID=96440 RepID=A0A8D0B3X4_SALMN